jgi:hypothetical protein
MIYVCQRRHIAKLSRAQTFFSPHFAIYAHERSFMEKFYILCFSNLERIFFDDWGEGAMWWINLKKNFTRSRNLFELLKWIKNFMFSK